MKGKCDVPFELLKLGVAHGPQCHIEQLYDQRISGCVGITHRE